MDTMDNTAYIEPQKIHFKLTGGDTDDYPIDLRASAELLMCFQNILDKSYCVLSGKKRLTSKDREDYQIRVKTLQVGSLTGDMLLIVKSAVMSLPLAGLANPKTIWEYACLALDFIKRYVAGKQNEDNVSINIGSVGNNSPVTVNLIVNSDVSSYPLEILDIARQSQPTYQKINRSMSQGNFTAFHANIETDAIGFSIDENERHLFSDNTNTISEEILTLIVDIFDFNKDNKCGRLRCLTGELTGREIPFSIIGQQSPAPYIQAMQETQVTIRAFTETTGTLETRIVRLHVTSLSET